MARFLFLGEVDTPRESFLIWAFVLLFLMLIIYILEEQFQMVLGTATFECKYFWFHVLLGIVL